MKNSFIAFLPTEESISFLNKAKGHKINPSDADSIKKETGHFQKQQKVPHILILLISSGMHSETISLLKLDFHTEVFCLVNGYVF